MMRSSSIPSYWFILLLSIPLVRAAVTTIKLERTNEALTYLGSFSFTDHGHTRVNVSHLVVYSPEKITPPDAFMMGFFFVSRVNSSAILSNPENSTTCILTNPRVKSLFSLTEVPRVEGNGENSSFAFHSLITEPGQYDLYFSNCASTRIISATVNINLYNQEQEGAQKYYLPVGQGPVPFISFGVSTVYGIILIIWLWHGKKIWLQGIPPQTFHVFLSVLLLVSLLVQLFKGFQYWALQMGGTANTWTLIYNISFVFHTLLGVATFFTGLPKLEPYLSDLESGVLLLSVPTLLISYTVLEIFSPPLQNTVWEPCFRILRSFFTALSSISWSMIAVIFIVGLLTWVCSFSGKDGNKGQGQRDDRDVENPFSRFYLLASAYVLTVSFVMKLLGNIVSYRFDWFMYLLCELSAVAFWGYVVYRYRPRTEKSVYQLFDETDSMDEELENL